jgi:CRISPR-associated protein Cas1
LEELRLNNINLIIKVMPILPTHKTTIEYLEHCRVQASDERLVYVKRKDAIEQHFAIPYGNTSVLLLGPGTSLTQQAARLAASQGMLVGFCAGGATPIYLAALNEYREPEYLQKWYPLWDNEAKRLIIAKHWQTVRAELVCKTWLKLEGVEIDCNGIADSYLQRVANANDTQSILIAEAWFAKQLYAQ